MTDLTGISVRHLGPSPRKTGFEGILSGVELDNGRNSPARPRREFVTWLSHVGHFTRVELYGA